MKKISLLLIIILSVFILACTQNKKRDKTAKEILGNPDYLAMSYGGYRGKTRDEVPSVKDIKEDMKILNAMGVKIIRTYNTKLRQIDNILEAISELKAEDSSFEMYVMLGAWIDCKGAWSKELNHREENLEANKAEIDRAVAFAKKYPDIIKVIAVGNEAMVHWATSYFVYPNVILKWVNHLQDLKKKGELSKDLWITSSDNYESWGGGDTAYHNKDLEALIHAVDYVSLHTYPFHETHFHSDFWIVPESEEELSEKEKIESAMNRAITQAKEQYNAVAEYIKKVGADKPIHIGETGWATTASVNYGQNGSKAADEFKEKIFYESMRKWTNDEKIACFYFEAFDEQWKDPGDALGSENHFGLINLQSEAKYVLWDMVDKGVFDGLTRNGKPITKTFGGDKEKMMKNVFVPPLLSDVGFSKTETVNTNRKPGETVTENQYVVLYTEMQPYESAEMTYPSAPLRVNTWEGTCNMKLALSGELEITAGTGEWWGCALEMESGGIGEDLTQFADGFLNFEIRGETESSIQIGFQTGMFLAGNQVNNYVVFEPGGKYFLTKDWNEYKIPVKEINKNGNLKDVNGIIYFRGDKNNDGKTFAVRKIYYSKN